MSSFYHRLNLTLRGICINFHKENGVATFKSAEQPSARAEVGRLPLENRNNSHRWAPQIFKTGIAAIFALITDMPDKSRLVSSLLRTLDALVPTPYHTNGQRLLILNDYRAAMDHSIAGMLDFLLDDPL